MTKDDLNSLVWPAMRYALGRKTYVVDTVCRALINNAKDIRIDIRKRMSQEIEAAILKKQAGMNMDVELWLKVIESFEKD